MQWVRPWCFATDLAPIHPNLLKDWPHLADERLAMGFARTQSVAPPLSDSE